MGRDTRRFLFPFSAWAGGEVMWLHTKHPLTVTVELQSYLTLSSFNVIFDVSFQTLWCRRSRRNLLSVTINQNYATDFIVSIVSFKIHPSEYSDANGGASGFNQSPWRLCEWSSSSRIDEWRIKYSHTACCVGKFIWSRHFGVTKQRYCCFMSDNEAPSQWGA